MKIPNSFDLQSHTIKVVYDDKMLDAERCYGMAEYDQCKITLCNKKGGKPLPASVIQHTFYHETVHLILTAMGEDKKNKNEIFVDTFAGLLCQILNTQKFKKDSNGKNTHL